LILHREMNGFAAALGRGADNHDSTRSSERADVLPEVLSFDFLRFGLDFAPCSR
jgi:hypothetical protein